MPDVLNLTDGLLRLTDGTRTLDVSPTVGDGGIADAAETETYLHRGKIIVDGSGVRLADESPAEVTFTAMVASDETDDDENLVTICRWMRGAASSAMTAAAWASTTTRGDTHRTLHVDWYPSGTASGAAYYRIADAMLVTAPVAEGRPTSWSMTFRSTTAPRPALAYVP
jgi:hypothetical protein